MLAAGSAVERSPCRRTAGAVPDVATPRRLPLLPRGALEIRQPLTRERGPYRHCFLLFEKNYEDIQHKGRDGELFSRTLLSPMLRWRYLLRPDKYISTRPDSLSRPFTARTLFLYNLTPVCEGVAHNGPNM